MGGGRENENYRTNTFPNKAIRCYLKKVFMVLTAKVCTSKRIGGQTVTVLRECSQDDTMLKGQGNSFDCDNFFVVFICQRLIITYTFSNSYKKLDILRAITLKHWRRALTCKPAGDDVLTPVMESTLPKKTNKKKKYKS